MFRGTGKQQKLICVTLFMTGFCPEAAKPHECCCSTDLVYIHGHIPSTVPSLYPASPLDLSTTSFDTRLPVCTHILLNCGRLSRYPLFFHFFLYSSLFIFRVAIPNPYVTRRITLDRPKPHFDEPRGMAPSPSSAEHARVIRELARDLQSSPRSLPSPSPSPIGRDPIDESYHSLPQSSAFEPTQEGLVSTQQLDETTKGHLLRSSARRFGYYNPPAPAPHVNTSMVAKEFVDFDQEGHSEDSLSVEFARGAKRSLHSTPAKGRPLADVSGNSLFNLEQDSLYDVTPPSLSRKSIRKSLGVPSSLRRDAQIRRASSAPQNELVGNATNGDRRRSTLQQMHSKVASEEDVSFNEERPPTVTATFKSTRFSNARRVSSNHNTPQKQTSGTPRSAPATGNGTQQSFMLPDLPNLTELVSGVFQDGTPVFSKTAKARSRFFSAPNAGRFPSSKANYPPIDRIPIPSEEKALFTSLQLLKEKVTQLEKDKAAAEKTIEEQAVEIAKLRMTNQTRSPTFEANAPAHWKSEKSSELAVTNAIDH